MPDEQLISDEGSQVVFIEAAPEGVNRGALYVRVGPVFDQNIPRPEPGVWVDYQEGYLKTGMHGPVLFSPASWREMVLEVEQRLQDRGVMPPDADGGT